MKKLICKNAKTLVNSLRTIRVSKQIIQNLKKERRLIRVLKGSIKRSLSNRTKKVRRNTKK
jgi:hypothetical protein